MSTSAENGTVQVNYVNGYASLATFIASDSDRSTAIFRRFDKLSARVLLHLQSELEELEAELDLLDGEDNRGTTSEKAGVRSVSVLKQRAKGTGDSAVAAQKRLDIIEDIEAKMKRYREALILESTLLSLKPPVPRVLSAFRNVFNNHSTAGEPFPALARPSQFTYNQEDLIALKQPMDEDKLSTFLRNYFPMLFVVRKTNRPLTYISESRLHAFVAVINVLVAAGLLFGSIYNLYYVSSDHVKLGLITVYTIAFAVCVGLLTNARRPEVFAACAAYAAVMVVFVSGGLGGNVNSTKS